MRILVVTQYYYPEIGAASKRLTELTRLWEKQGHDVHVYTAIPNYPLGRVYKGYEENKSFIEEIEGITIFRNSVDRGKSESKFNKVKSYLSFMISSYKNVKKLLNNYDVVVTSVGPIFSGFIGHYISKRKKIPSVLEFRDITFKSLEATNYTNNIVINLMKKLELYFCKKANHVVTVTETYGRILEENGVGIGKMTTIPNGYLLDKEEEINTSHIDHILKIINKEKEKERKIVGYFGTLGISQGIEEIVEQFLSVEKYTLLIIGNGSREQKIKKLAQDSDNIYVFGSVSSKGIQYLYSQVDFNLIKILNDPAFSGTIPSKIFEIIGNGGLPLYIGPQGEAQEIICSINSHLYYEDISSMLYFLECLSLNKVEVQQLKLKGKKLLLDRYNREKHAEIYLGVMNKTVNRI
ncbi:MULTISPECIES: glycosyltransferase family 4 protein [Bacillus cereus group]|uniref:glycosyltransferase family 4 protein n=1 Tax=Bacillus cereus group TaxID=86661 RepID=UPI0019629832|nr:glycosyltransferase family 4 protein [Bacillus cereus]MBM6769044.1 glycosyltransferase family 4 protein [Bacillus cereus]